jgi:hypothetical protein
MQPTDNDPRAARPAHCPVDEPTLGILVMSSLRGAMLGGGHCKSRKWQVEGNTGEEWRNWRHGPREVGASCSLPRVLTWRRACVCWGSVITTGVGREGDFHPRLGERLELRPVTLVWVCPGHTVTRGKGHRGEICKAESWLRVEAEPAVFVHSALTLLVCLRYLHPAPIGSFSTRSDIQLKYSAHLAPTV